MMTTVITIVVLIIKQTENDAEMMVSWVVVTYFRKDLGYLFLPLYVARAVLEPADRSIQGRWCCIHS